MILPKESFMQLTKTSITIPDDLLKEARALSNNFSGLVAEALTEYLRQRRVQKAMDSFGSWKGHEESGVETANRLRSEGGRDYADRAD
jgi:post-segregation antitoxin (ccd killing protein)